MRETGIYLTLFYGLRSFSLSVANSVFQYVNNSVFQLLDSSSENYIENVFVFGIYANIVVWIIHRIVCSYADGCVENSNFIQQNELV